MSQNPILEKIKFKYAAVVPFVYMKITDPIGLMAVPVRDAIKMCVNGEKTAEDFLPHDFEQRQF
ncbi:Uncharacterised protein [uncultured archaeon]|nr:Uncharacterised protein [uncultured archaeon]